MSKKFIYYKVKEQDILDGAEFVYVMTETGLLFNSLDIENELRVEYRMSKDNPKFLVRDNAKVKGVDINLTPNLNWEIYMNLENWVVLKEFEDALKEELGYVIF